MIICDWCKERRGDVNIAYSQTFFDSKTDACYPCLNKLTSLDFGSTRECKEVATRVDWEKLAR